MINAKNGEVQVPVSKGCPWNIAVAFGPLKVASSLTTRDMGGMAVGMPELIVLTDVDMVVEVALLTDAIDRPDGEQPTKFGAVWLTAAHSC